MRYRRSILLTIMLVGVLSLALFATACGGSDATTTTAAGGSETTAPASGEPIKFGFTEGFTGFMAYDAELGEKGILTAFAMLDNQWEGRPLKYLKEDNASDPVQAVDKARKLVEVDKIDCMLGPIFSPSAKAVTDFLGRSSGIPQLSMVGQPTENLETANGLAFIHLGFFDSQAYYLGKYMVEQGWKTVNIIAYDDTPAYAQSAGLKKAFVEEAGGQVLSENYVPLDMVDFSAYLTTMPPADVTFFWIFGNGTLPFVKQYNDYGLTAPLVAFMAQDFADDRLADLGDLGLGLIASDYYAYTIDNQANKEFVAAYEKLYPGEKPTAQSYGAWQGVMMYLQALETTGGDTTPAKVIEAMSTMSFDGPTGRVTIVPHKTAFIPERDWFIFEVQRVGDALTMVPIQTFEQVLLGELD